MVKMAEEMPIIRDSTLRGAATEASPVGVGKVLCEPDAEVLVSLASRSVDGEALAAVCR